MDKTASEVIQILAKYDNRPIILAQNAACWWFDDGESFEYEVVDYLTSHSAIMRVLSNLVDDPRFNVAELMYRIGKSYGYEIRSNIDFCDIGRMFCKSSAQQLSYAAAKYIKDRLKDNITPRMIE